MFTPLVSSVWTKAVKADLLKKDSVNYKDFYKYSMGEDQFRTISWFTLAQKIKYINNPLYNYRTDNNSISRGFNVNTIEKKNTLYVYEKFLEMLPVWGMDNQDIINRLKATWLGFAVYTFNQYYKAVKSGKQRKAVVDFNWDSFLPSDLDLNNKHVGSSVLEMFNFISGKQYSKIRLIFLKNAIYKKIKSKIR